MMSELPQVPYPTSSQTAPGSGADTILAHAPQTATRTPEQGGLQKLAKLIQTAADVLRTEDQKRIFLVLVPDEEAPSVEVFTDRVTLGARVLALRLDLLQRQRLDPGASTFIYIFHGNQWQIQKGRTWQLFDGRTYMPLSAAEVTPILATDGSLQEILPPEELLPPPTSQPQLAPLPAVNAIPLRSPAPSDDLELPDFDVAGPDQEPELS
jgi:hypothetical protein